MVVTGGTARDRCAGDATLGNGGAKLDCGQVSRTVVRARRACDGRFDGNRDEVERLGARVRRSGPITIVIASAGRGDAEPFGLGGTDVGRAIKVLVAIGDGGARVNRGQALAD